MSKQEAIAKVRAELDSDKNNSYVQAVGNFMLQHLEEHPEFAEAVLSEDKTILKSLDAMRKVAEKKKVGNCAVLTDAEGFAVVLDYFKSTEPATKKPAEAKQEKQPAKAQPTKDEVEPEDDIDFDALLL